MSDRITGKIDEKGFITNFIPAIGLESDSKAIFELIDNSIDAKATNITISIDNEPIEWEDENENIIEYQGPFLIVKDNGYGMDNDNIQNLITICKAKDDITKNGKYGIGAIASYSTVNKNLYDTNKTSFTLIYTQPKGKKKIREIRIDWNIIKNSDNSNILNKIYPINSPDNNKEYFLENNGTHGVLIINTISKNDISKISDKLKFLSQMYYSYYLSNNLTINFNDNINKDKWTLNKDNFIFDFIGNIIHKNKLHSFKFNIYYDNEYNFYAEPTTKNLTLYSQENTNNLIIKLKKLNCNNHYPKDYDIIENDNIITNIKNNKIEFTLNIINQLDNNNQIKSLLNYHYSLPHDKYTGLYVSRNKRILADPCKIDNIPTERGTKLRCIIDYNNKLCNHDYLFPIQANKSQFSSKDIHPGLKRLVETLCKEIYLKKFYIDNKKFNEELFNKDKINISLIQPKKKTEKVDHKVELMQDNIDIKLDNEKENDTIKPRKSFTQAQCEEVLTTKQDGRCAILKTKLDKIYNPYEKDHIDNNSSNNSTDNLQFLSLPMHYLKTHKRYDELYSKIKDNDDEKRSYIITMVNKILDTPLLRDKIYFNDNQIFEINK
jgi:hypothetical protein